MWEEIGGGYTARGFLRQVKRSGRGPSGRGDAASGRTVNVVRTHHVVIRASTCCQIRRTPRASRRSAKSQIGTRNVFILTELARELCRSCPDCLALPSRAEVSMGILRSGFWSRAGGRAGHLRLGCRSAVGSRRSLPVKSKLAAGWRFPTHVAGHRAMFKPTGLNHRSCHI